MIDSHHQVVDARELALASASLIDPSFLGTVPEFSPNDMRGEFPSLIVATAQRRSRANLPADLYAVVDELDRGGALTEKCGPDVMHRIIALANAPVSSDPAALARQVHQEAERRRLATKLELLRHGITDPTTSMAAIRRQLSDMAEGLADPVGEPQIFDIARLVADYPNLRPAVVDLVFRRGETVNIIAKSKVGKSWFGYLLGLSIATGRNWLGQFRTTRGRVLLLDNELHLETLASRIRAVMSAMGLQPKDVSGWFDFLSLRGQSRDIHAVGPILRRIPRDKYSLIIVDAFYRLLPGGISENDNADMTEVYNAVDRYGDATGAAIALIHHATKGGQSEKDVTDVGSGAGAISRAADTHLILRPHEEDGAVVLDARLRSWEPLQPMGLRWAFPVWYPDDNLDPELLKGRKPPAEERKQVADKSDCDKILDALKAGPLSGRKLRGVGGIGREKLDRLLGLMVHENKLLVTEETIRGNTCLVYAVNPSKPSPTCAGDRQYVDDFTNEF